MFRQLRCALREGIAACRHFTSLFLFKTFALSTAESRNLNNRNMRVCVFIIEFIKVGLPRNNFIEFNFPALQATRISAITQLRSLHGILQHVCFLFHTVIMSKNMLQRLLIEMMVKVSQVLQREREREERDRQTDRQRGGLVIN